MERDTGTAPRASPAARRRARWDVVAVVAAFLVVVAVAAVGAVVLHDRSLRVAAPAPATSAPRPVIAVAGDDLASGDATWIRAAARDAHVTVVARVAPGVGYTTAGTTVGSLAAGVPSSAGAILLLGGGADAGRGALELLHAETRAIAAARAAAPTARLVVVGPLAAEGTTTVRSTLATSARLAGIRFVDPVADRWLTADQAGAAGEHPDAAGRAVLEQRVAALLIGD